MKDLLARNILDPRERKDWENCEPKFSFDLNDRYKVLQTNFNFNKFPQLSCETTYKWCKCVKICDDLRTWSCIGMLKGCPYCSILLPLKKCFTLGKRLTKNFSCLQKCFPFCHQKRPPPPKNEKNRRFRSMSFHILWPTTYLRMFDQEYK